MSIFIIYVHSTYIIKIQGKNINLAIYICCRQFLLLDCLWQSNNKTLGELLYQQSPVNYMTYYK